MAGSTDSFLSLAKGLEENLGKAVKQLQSFNDVSQKVNKSFSTTNKELNTSRDVSKQVNDNFDNIGKSTDKNREKTSQWGGTLSKIASSAKGIVGIFTAGMAGLSFLDAIKGAVELHQNMRDLGYQMGLGAKGAKQLEDGIMNIGAATGFPLGEVTAMVTTLTKMKVPLDNMKQLATDSLRFAEITGASNSTIAQMTGGLTKMGGMGAKSISNMMATIVQTQRAFGMTGQAVETLANNITDTTSVLKNMGKSSNEIEKFQKGTVKLAGAFTSVGIEASTATDLINRMLDPGKLENNALLFAKMGISIEDAMSGNIDPGKLISGLQGIGSELKDMAGPQASALANALGIPLNQLRQMGNMDANGIEKMAKEMGMITNGSGELAKAQDDQATAQRDMAQVWEKIKGTIGNIVIKLMPVFDVLAKLINQNMGKILGWVNGIVNAGFIEKFIGKLVTGIKFVGGFISKAFDGIGKLFSKLDPKILLLGLVALVGGIILFKKKFASVATDSAEAMTSSFRGSSEKIGKEIATGISAGLEMGTEKGAAVYKAKMLQAGRVTSDSLTTRIKDGHQYAAISAAAAYQKLLGGQNTFGWAKKMNESTGEWLEKIKMGGKPVSALATYYKNSQDAIIEKIKLSGVDYKNEENSLKSKYDGEKKLQEELKKRMELLKGLGSVGPNGEIDFEQAVKMNKMTSEQVWEYGKINTALGGKNGINKEILKTEKELNDIAMKEANAKAAYVNKLGPDALKLYSDELKASQDKLEADRKGLIERNTAIESEKITLGLINDSLKLRKDEIDLKLASGSATVSDLEDLKKINNTLSENKTLTEQLGEEFNKNNDGMDELENSLNKLGVDLEVAAKATDKMKIGDSGQMFKSFGQKLKDGATGAMGLMKSKFTDIGETLGKSLHGVGKAIGERMNPKNWLAAVRAEGDGNLFKGAAKILGNGIKGAIAGVGKLTGGIGKIGSKIASSKAGKAMGSVGKGLKGMGKAGKVVGGAALGGAALLIGAMMKSEKGKEVMAKIQEKLTEVMAKIMPAVGAMIDGLMPALTGLIDNLLPTIMGLVDQLLPVIQSVMAKIMPVVMSLMESIMPMIMGLVDSLLPLIMQLVPVIMGLVKNLLPPIMGLMSALMPIMMSLIKLLLPPILKVLSFLLNVLGELITAIGGMISALGMKEVGDSIKSVGKGMKDAATGMSRSADLMSGNIMELTSIMKKEDLDKANRDAMVKNLNENTKKMTATLGITTAEASTMTVADITEKIKGTKASKDLMNQMELNNKELAKQYTLISAQNLANTMAVNLKAKGEAGQAAALVGLLDREGLKTTGLGGRDDNMARAMAEKGVLDEFIKAVKENGGIDDTILKEYKTFFEKAGYKEAKAQDFAAATQEDWMNYADLQFKAASRAGLTIDGVRSVITDMQRSLGANSAEYKALAGLKDSDITTMLKSSKGDAEQLKALLTGIYSKEGGSLSEAGIAKVTGESIEYAIAGLKGATGEAGLVKQLKDIETGKYDSEQKRSDALMAFLRKNDAVFAATVKGMGIKEIIARADKLVADNPDKPAGPAVGPAGTEPPKGSIETKMYPAMLSAVEAVNGSLGFIQTADARTIKGGMTDAELALAKQEETIKLLRELVVLGGTSNGFAALTVEQQAAFNKMTKEQQNKYLLEMAGGKK